MPALVLASGALGSPSPKWFCQDEEPITASNGDYWFEGGTDIVYKRIAGAWVLATWTEEVELTEFSFATATAPAETWYAGGAFADGDKLTVDVDGVVTIRLELDPGADGVTATYTAVDTSAVANAEDLATAIRAASGGLLTGSGEDLVFTSDDADATTVTIKRNGATVVSGNANGGPYVLIKAAEPKKRHIIISAIGEADGQFSNTVHVGYGANAAEVTGGVSGTGGGGTALFTNFEPNVGTMYDYPYHTTAWDQVHGTSMLGATNKALAIAYPEDAAIAAPSTFTVTIKGVTI